MMPSAVIQLLRGGWLLMNLFVLYAECFPTWSWGGGGGLVTAVQKYTMGQNAENK